MNKLIAFFAPSFKNALRKLKVLVDYGITWKDGTPIFEYERGLNKENKSDFAFMVDVEAKKLGYISGEIVEKCQRNNISLIDDQQFQTIFGEYKPLICYHSGQVIEGDDFELVDGEPIRSDVLADEYFWCEACNSYHSQNEEHYIESESRSVCQQCFDDNYFT